MPAACRKLVAGVLIAFLANALAWSSSSFADEMAHSVGAYGAHHSDQGFGNSAAQDCGHCCHASSHFQAQAALAMVIPAIAGEHWAPGSSQISRNNTLAPPYRPPLSFTL
jgi:hypothetical protein